MRWTVLIPVKALPSAKSRLVDVSADQAAHRRLVEAIRRDTIAAAGAAEGVARLVAVSDEPGVVNLPTIVQIRPGLNEALADAAWMAAKQWQMDGIAALVGDLPALRAEDLSAALRQARGPRSFVPDASGLGTTLLVAWPGVELEPNFGPGSAARHAAIADALEVGAGLRLDVDSAADLDAAAALGLGPATREALAASEVQRANVNLGWA